MRKICRSSSLATAMLCELGSLRLRSARRSSSITRFPMEHSAAKADAPASKSDLRPFDVITQVDGTPIETDSQLQHEILKKKIGQNVQLTVWRKGQTIKVPMKTGELPNEIARASNALPTPPRQPSQENVGKFGLQVQELTEQVAKRLKLPTEKGVIVTDVEDNSIA